jgi:hypothetical protein
MSIEFTGNKSAESLVKGATNLETVQTAVADAFKELYNIVFEKGYDEGWTIDFRKGPSQVASPNEPPNFSRGRSERGESRMEPNHN